MRCRPRLDIVAVDGFAPSTHGLVPAALHAELYGIPCYIWLASPKPSELFCPYRHPFLSSFALLFHFVCSLLATIQPTSHVPPSLGLTLLPICPVCCYHSNHPHPVGSYRFGNYLRQIVVLATLFHVAYFHSLLGLVSFDAVSVPPPGFPSVTICQPTYRDCTLHVPRRLWKVRESNPPAHPRLFGESP